MAQAGDTRQNYPPQENNTQGSYYAQQQSPNQRPPTREDANQYPGPPSSSEPPRQGQYPTPPAQDPRGAPPAYPPPAQWPGQHHSAYPPPPHHYPDPQQGAYPYPPPGHRPDMAGPPQPLQPDAYRLPPPHIPNYGYGYYPPQPPPQPAPRQRTAIACKYCRKRKIRCSGYENSSDGRCQNCVRFNQTCLFHPVSSQAAFVPVSAIYGANGGRPPAPGGDGRPNDGQYRNGDQSPLMLYGAHGQPLGPSPTHAQQPQYNYGQPPPGYPPQGYPYPYPPQGHPQQPPPPPQPQHSGSPPRPGSGPSGQNSDSQGPTQSSDDRVGLKRPPPDEDPHNENSQTWSQSPHPNSRARHSTYDSRANSSGSYSYHDPAVLTPTSPATSVMSHQSHPQPHANGNQAHKDNNSPPGLTPTSTQGLQSPHTGPTHEDVKSPQPHQTNSASSSVNGRAGMSVNEMITGSHGGPLVEQRAKNDNEMLSKLDGKK